MFKVKDLQLALRALEAAGVEEIDFDASAAAPYYYETPRGRRPLSITIESPNLDVRLFRSMGTGTADALPCRVERTTLQ